MRPCHSWRRTLRRGASQPPRRRPGGPPALLPAPHPELQSRCPSPTLRQRYRSSRCGSSLPHKTCRTRQQGPRSRCPCPMPRQRQGSSECRSRPSTRRHPLRRSRRSGLRRKLHKRLHPAGTSCGPTSLNPRPASSRPPPHSGRRPRSLCRAGSRGRSPCGHGNRLGRSSRLRSQCRASCPSRHDRPFSARRDHSRPPRRGSLRRRSVRIAGDQVCRPASSASHGQISLVLNSPI